MNYGSDYTLRFEAVRGSRINRYFWAVTLTEITEENLWWNTTLLKWGPYRENPNHSYSTHAPCHTLKAFKRMLKKYPEIRGKCCLVSRYAGFDVYSEKPV